MNRFEPGERAPLSSQYGIVGTRGRDTGKDRTAVRSVPLPTTPASGQSYEISDLTKNGSERS